MVGKGRSNGFEMVNRLSNALVRTVEERDGISPVKTGPKLMEKDEFLDFGSKGVISQISMKAEQAEGRRRRKKSTCVAPGGERIQRRHGLEAFVSKASIWELPSESLLV